MRRTQWFASRVSAQQLGDANCLFSQAFVLNQQLRWRSLRDYSAPRPLRCAVPASRKPRVAILATRATHASHPLRGRPDGRSPPLRGVVELAA
jgi:hypothetical protein